MLTLAEKCGVAWESDGTKFFVEPSVAANVRGVEKE